MTRRLISALAVAFMLTACGSGGSSTSGGGDATLTVTEPAAGATVTTPFTVKVSGAELGTSETGKHHIHIWFDGNETEYQISYTDTAEVTGAPAGAHTMTVSLRNANHSDAGPRVDVPITVGQGGGGGGVQPTNDPYEY